MCVLDRLSIIGLPCFRRAASVAGAWIGRTTRLDTDTGSSGSCHRVPDGSRGQIKRYDDLRDQAEGLQGGQLLRLGRWKATGVAHLPAYQSLGSALIANSYRFRSAAPALRPHRQSPVAELFETCWREIEQRYGEGLLYPKEVVFLNGAPGSGKGSNTEFMKRYCGLFRSLTVSQLLQGSGVAQALMQQGELVPDVLVYQLLLDAIFNPEENDGLGLVIDGFPRTSQQVEFLILLYKHMLQKSQEHRNSAFADSFPRPSFKVVVLYIDEETSVARQMARAQHVQVHNRKFLDAGVESMVKEARSTDLSPEKCRKRYAMFKENYPAMLQLQEVLPFSIIDATGDLSDCQEQIKKQLRYQSSLDLAEDTYRAICHLPLAREMAQIARVQLVQRLDAYVRKDKHVFMQVVGMIEAEVLPLWEKSSLAGHAVFDTMAPLFTQQPQAAAMLVDVLSDRGFSVSHNVEERYIPEKVDLASGNIECSCIQHHQFRITFEKASVRVPAEVQADRCKPSQDAEARGLISTLIVPEHLDHQDKDRDRLAAMRACKRVRMHDASLNSKGSPQQQTEQQGVSSSSQLPELPIARLRGSDVDQGNSFNEAGDARLPVQSAYPDWERQPMLTSHMWTS